MFPCNFAIFQKTFLTLPRYLCNGVPNKIRAEIILTQPDPDNAGVGKAKMGFVPLHWLLHNQIFKNEKNLFLAAYAVAGVCRFRAN
jgi:hypothetical protein